jgi:hypothetical protein
MRSAFFAAAVLLASMAQVPAGSAPAPAGGWTETPHLRVRTSISHDSKAPDGTATLVVEIEPKPKMHVYAPGQPDYIPVSLDLVTDASYTAAPPQFPAAERFLFEPLNEQQLVYAKPFRIADRVTLAPQARRQKVASAGRLTIAGTLRYQACDDKVCYIPTTVPLQWTVTRAAAAAKQ